MVISIRFNYYTALTYTFQVAALYLTKDDLKSKKKMTKIILYTIILHKTSKLHVNENITDDKTFLLTLNDNKILTQITALIKRHPQG